MRSYIIFIAFVLIAWLGTVSCAPQVIQVQGAVVVKRSAPTARPRTLPTGMPAKRPTTLRPLRKGEYPCGDKICSLQPGEVPRGCEGHFCQMRLGGPKPNIP